MRIFSVGYEYGGQYNMKIKNVISILLLLLSVSACSSTGANVIGMAGLAGASIPGVIKTIADITAIPDDINMARGKYNKHAGRSKADPVSKLFYCLIEVNKDRPEEDKLRLSREEADILLKGGSIDTLNDPRRGEVQECMHTKDKQFNMNTDVPAE